MTPRMSKVIFCQVIAAVVIAFASAFICNSLMDAFLSGFDRWFQLIIISPAAYVIFRLMSGLALAVIASFVYQGNVSEFIKDREDARNESERGVQGEQAGVVAPSLKEPPLQTTTINVLDHSDIIGKYMDADIYEWMDIGAHEDNPVRVLFEGTMKMPRDSEEFRVPDNCIMIPPGIVYKLQV